MKPKFNKEKLKIYFQYQSIFFIKKTMKIIKSIIKDNQSFSLKKIINYLYKIYSKDKHL